MLQPTTTSTARRRARAVAFRALAAAVFATGAVTAASDATAGAGGDASGWRAPRRDVHVTFTRVVDPSAPPATSAGPVCTAGGRCLIAFAGSAAELSGDVVGTLLGAGAAAPLAQGAPGAAATVAVLDLVTSPCGAGSIVAAGIIASDPERGNTATWQFVAGTGTGALERASGSGTAELSADGSTATYRGRIRCDDRSPRHAGS